MSIADEIAKLHELRSRGALTTEEFERAKARLLDAAPGPGARLAINRLRRTDGDRLVFGGFTLFAYIVFWIFVPREEP